MEKTKRNNWSGLTEAEKEQWFAWIDAYVPAYDWADTKGGEILRAMNNLIYEWHYNDIRVGGMDGYGFVGYDNYLQEVVPNYSTLDKEDLYGLKYKNRLYANCRRVYKYLMNNLDLFEEANTYDSRTMCDWK